MKRIYDLKHREREFQVRDFVYLKLQPYRQLSVAARKNLKLSACFYGPFEVLDRIGKVAYKLKLPSTSKIHPVFHVSMLKGKIGESTQVLQTLSEVLNHEVLSFIPQAVLDERVKRGKVECLIHWQWLLPTNATWEDRQRLQKRFPTFILADEDIS